MISETSVYDALTLVSQSWGIGCIEHAAHHAAAALESIFKLDNRCHSLNFFTQLDLVREHLDTLPLWTDEYELITCYIEESQS